MVGDRDHLRLVLDHEDGVALVAQPQQEVVHPLDVVGVQPDRRLVEDVGHVGERRPEVADHLGALRFTARQRARRPVEAEIAEPDLHERVERVPQRRQQRRDRRLLQTARPLRQVVDLHRARAGDVDPLDLGGPGGLVEPGAAALGAGGEGDRALHEGADVRLHGVDVLGQERLLDRRDQTRVRQVDAVDLDLGRLLVEKRVQLLLAELLDWLVRVEVAAAPEDAAVPAVHAVAGDRERTLVERLAVVVQRGQVEVADRAHALAARAHAAVVDDVAHHDPFALALVDGHRPARFPGRDVERVGRRRTDVRLADAAPQHAQHRVCVRDGADRRAGVGAHSLLVDDDRGRQPFQDVDVGPGQRRHESLHERAVGLVDQPLRLRRDGAKHQRRLARSRDAGEHGQPPLGDLDADVLQVVLPRPLDADQVVVGRGAVCHDVFCRSISPRRPVVELGSARSLESGNRLHPARAYRNHLPRRHSTQREGWRWANSRGSCVQRRSLSWA